VAEAGGGLVAGVGLAVATRAAVEAADGGRSPANAAALPAYLIGTGAGTWLTGELLDGRSANPRAAFFGAVGGSGAGIGAGFAVLLLGYGVGFVSGEAGLCFYMAGFATTVAAPPILSAVLYNSIKKPREAGASALTVTPSITALSPRGRGAAPTLAYGFSMSF
jgi:hypothetical protein